MCFVDGDNADVRGTRHHKLAVDNARRQGSLGRRGERGEDLGVYDLLWLGENDHWPGGWVRRPEETDGLCLGVAVQLDDLDVEAHERRHHVGRDGGGRNDENADASAAVHTQREECCDEDQGLARAAGKLRPHVHAVDDEGGDQLELVLTEVRDPEEVEQS